MKSRPLALFLPFLFVSGLMTLMGLVVASTLFLEFVGPEGLPLALVIVGGVGFALGLSREALRKHTQMVRSLTFFLALVLICFFLARVFLHHMPAATSYFLFVVVEVTAYLLGIRWTGLLRELFGGEVPRYLHLTLSAGGVVGSLLSAALTRWLFAGDIVVLLIVAAAILLALSVSLQRKVIATEAPHHYLPEGVGVALRVVRRYPMIWMGSLAVFILFVLRSLLHVGTLDRYAQIDFIGPFLGVLFAAVIALLALTRWLFGRLVGRFGIPQVNLIFPVIALAVAIYWVILPKALTPAMLATWVYLALLPGLALPIFRLDMEVLPHRYHLVARAILLDLAAPLGVLLGGAFAFWGARPVALVVTLLFTGLAVAIAIVYRSRWLRSLRLTGDELKSLGRLPPTPPEEIDELIKQEDPSSQGLGFLLAAAKHPERHLAAAREGLPLMQSSVAWKGALDYLGTLPPESLAELLQSEEPALRAWTLGAMSVHKIPVGIELLTASMRDENAWVRLLACAAAWRLGFGQLASVTWESLALASIEDRALIGFLDIVERAVTPETLTVLKKLAWYPSPRVRAKAMRVLGRVLERQAEGDADLFETGLQGAKHEDPEVRAAAVKLIVFSEADNAPEHVGLLLGDPIESVRVAAAEGLAMLDAHAISKMALGSEREEVVHAALMALGKMGERGEAIIQEHLKPLYARVSRLSHFPATLLYGTGLWTPVSTVLRSFRERVLRQTETALRGMEHEGAAFFLRTAEADRDAYYGLRRAAPRWLFAGIEPLLHSHSKKVPAFELAKADPRVVSGLKQLIDEENGWIRRAAQMVWNEVYEGQSEEDPLMNRLIFLKNIPYFAHLTIEELLIIDQKLSEEDFVKGETIFEEGSSGDCLYLIYSGSVALYRGDKVHLADLEAGAMFAEMALFEEQPRSATAIAREDTVLLALSQEHFHELTLQTPKILLEICRELSRRLRETGRRLASG